MRITELPKADSIKSGDVLMIDGEDGARSVDLSMLGGGGSFSLSGLPIDYQISSYEAKIPYQIGDNTPRVINAKNMYYSLLENHIAQWGPSYNAVVPIRQSIYRGSNIGTKITDTQLANISNGMFTNMFIGDYWVINNITWRIADFDYWYSFGDTPCKTHHVLVIPDKILGNALWNGASGVTGGYKASKLFTTELATSIAQARASFGNDHVLQHREYISNAVTNGLVSGRIWDDVIATVLSESMITGSPSNALLHQTNSFDGYAQMAIFKLSSFWINPYNERFWLNDIVSINEVGAVVASGRITESVPNNAVTGVRPAFAIY